MLLAPCSGWRLQEKGILKNKAHELHNEDLRNAPPLVKEDSMGIASGHQLWGNSC